MKLKLKYVLFMIIAIMLFSSCTTSKFTVFYRNYQTIYLSIAKNVNLTDIDDSVKKLQSKENTKRINDLKSLLDETKPNVPSNRKEVYDQLYKQYEGIVFLRDSFSRWNNLTEEEQQKVDIIMRSLDFDRLKAK